MELKTARREARDNQRWRMLDAMAHLAGKHGYGAVTVAHVIERAGVSRKAFYEYFADKEACFLAAYDELSTRLLETLVAEGANARGTDRTRAQLSRYLDVLGRDLPMARAFIVEVMGAGPKSLLLRDRVNGRFAEAVFGHTSKDPVVRRALIGGVNDVVTGALLGRPKVKKLSALLPSLVRFVGQT
ncbi:MAG: TetR/AcrR family transcriptional regulator [Archangium sp.]